MIHPLARFLVSPTPGSSRLPLLARIPFNTNQAVKSSTVVFSRSITTTPPSRKRNKAIPWTKEEIQRLTLLFADGRYSPPAELQAALPGRTLIAIKAKVIRLKLSTHGRAWTQDEIDTLKELDASGLKPIEMVKSFKYRTQTSIMLMISKLRPPTPIRKVSPAILTTSSNQDHSFIIEPKPVTHKQFWTPQEDENLRKLVQKAKEAYPDQWTRELRKILSDTEGRQGLHPSRSALTALRRLHSLDRGEQNLGLWTAAEDKLLKDAVSTEIGPNFYPIIDLTIDAAKNKDDQKSLKQEQDQPQKQYLTLYSKELRNIDWDSVAEQVQSKDQYSCRRRFLRKMTNRHHGSWTGQEFELLKKYLVEYGEDWRKISRALGTRTPTQVKTKYTHAFLSIKDD